MATLAVPDLLRVQVDQERGGLTQVEFLQYFERDRETHVRLGSAAYPFLSLDLAPLTGNGNGEQEEVRSRVVNRDSRSLILERTLPAQGLSVTESWTLREDSYLADYSVLFEAVGEEGVDVPDFVVGAGAISLERLDLQGGGNKRMAGMTMQVSLMPEGARQSKTYVLGKVEKLGPADRAALRNTPVDWVAVHSKYFMFALVRDGNVMPGAMLEVVGQGEASADSALAVQIPYAGMRLEPGESRQLVLRGFAGPKEYDRLMELGSGLEDVLDLDRFMMFRPAWMKYLTTAILKSLLGIHKFFNGNLGYGWIIIFITIVIKLLFWPLTHYSTVSMRRMQRIQPLMQEIRQKHKDDPQKANRKVMELYKEHKVNPLGGCLPMLLQIPVFFGLFNTLRNAIELRQTSFLWVADLSMPDTLPGLPIPVRPLAIIMVLTMLLQQKLTPTSPDPSQARMMLFMTVFFAFIFYSMPAGLTLYWSCNQILSIGQNLLTHRLEKRHTERQTAAPA
jgi:YidC/Oxa1 family membrane protein insertase